MKVALIFLGGTNIQNICFWPSYSKCEAGYPHDLIFVHMNWAGVGPYLLDREISVPVLIENKINSNGEDLPHKAFGAYRHYFNKYKTNYDVFIFISDDVVIRRDNWLKDIITTLDKHPKLGFGASQVNHMQNREGSPFSHIKAPFWFAKTEALIKTKWEFNNDHEGELRIGDQITKAGFFGVQVGNKINLAYDSLEANYSHITSVLERKFFPEKNYIDKFEKEELDFFEKQISLLTEEQVRNSEPLESLWPHIPPQNIYIDIEPFNGLLYRPGINIAKECIELKEVYSGIYTI